MHRFLQRGALFALALFAPALAWAHEVYVLSPEQIESGLAAHPVSPLSVVEADPTRFFFWAGIGAFVVFLVFAVSLSRRLEQRLDPLLLRVKHYGPAVARITIGLSFIAAAYYGALFGPELPLAESFGSLAPFITFVLIALGVCITSGFYTRWAALVALGLFSYMTYLHGAYMLTYTNYLGEIAVLLVIGSHRGGVDRLRLASARARHALDRMHQALAPYSFAFLRVCFGISLLYASLYAKFIHANLAYQVASLPLAGHAHSLAFYFGFEPHFLVLGAGIVEIVIGLFFLLGIEIRFTAIFIEFWLALSLIYFGEVVWPHIILIGIPIAFALYGYDRYSLEGYFFKRGGREPVF